MTATASASHVFVTPILYLTAQCVIWQQILTFEALVRFRTRALRAQPRAYRASLIRVAVSAHDGIKHNLLRNWASELVGHVYSLENGVGPCHCWHWLCGRALEHLCRGYSNGTDILLLLSPLRLLVARSLRLRPRPILRLFKFHQQQE